MNKAFATFLKRLNYRKKIKFLAKNGPWLWTRIATALFFGRFSAVQTKSSWQNL